MQELVKWIQHNIEPMANVNNTYEYDTWILHMNIHVIHTCNYFTWFTHVIISHDSHTWVVHIILTHEFPRKVLRCTCNVIASTPAWATTATEAYLHNYKCMQIHSFSFDTCNCFNICLGYHSYRWISTQLHRSQMVPKWYQIRDSTCLHTPPLKLANTI